MPCTLISSRYRIEVQDSRGIKVPHRRPVPLATHRPELADRRRRHWVVSARSSLWASALSLSQVVRLPQVSVPLILQAIREVGVHKEPKRLAVAELRDRGNLIFSYFYLLNFSFLKES